jgi:hypothetical protein
MRDRLWTPEEAKNSQTLWFQAKQPLRLLSRRMSRTAFRHKMARYAGNQLLVHLYEVFGEVYEVSGEVYELCGEVYEVSGEVYEVFGEVYEVSGEVYEVSVHLYELCVHLYQVLDFFKDGKTFLIDNIQRVHLHLFRSRLIF